MKLKIALAILIVLLFTTIVYAHPPVRPQVYVPAYTPVQPVDIIRYQPAPVTIAVPRPPAFYYKPYYPCRPLLNLGNFIFAPWTPMYHNPAIMYNKKGLDQRGQQLRDGKGPHGLQYGQRGRGLQGPQSPRGPQGLRGGPRDGTGPRGPQQGMGPRYRGQRKPSG